MAITDTFTGANGTNIETYSANWTVIQGAASLWLITGNKLAIQGGSSVEVAAKYAGTFPTDQYAQIVATPVDTANSYVGACVRASAGGNYYGYYRGANGLATGVSQLFRTVTGGWTQLGSDGASRILADGDVIRLTAAGTTLTPEENGSTTNTPGAQTDSSIPNGSPGIAGFSASVALHPLLDAFECSDAVVATSRPGRMMMMGCG